MERGQKEMKADKAIRLLKTVDQVGITHFEDANIPPTLSSSEIAFSNSRGWSIVLATNTATASVMICEWSDTIDIAGLAANDISLINSGGAVGRPSSPFSLLTSNSAVSQMTLVSVNPIELVATDIFTANALDEEGNLQDYFLATNQEYVKAADSVYVFTKSGEHNFGTGGIAQASKLYVKSFIVNYVQKPLNDTSGDVNIPPCTVALAAVTAELDPIQMAAAIYRANDQE